MIDIVVPVYNAADDLVRCVQSVLAHTSRESYRLTLIDDGSPQTDVARVLGEMATSAPWVRILANPTNLGFTETVNRAFRETDGDVLLLNSDTVVTPGWLPAMTRCLHSDHRIATVTPFSNNAEIASIPLWLQANPVPSDEVATQYAKACADTDAGVYPDLPTGVGFCMLIRRAAITAVGAFDVETFGRGYGEENDWCQRAIKIGWRNVLCVGAYVVHTGGQSFSESKAALVARNIVKLNQKHPGYDLDVQRFIARDPIKFHRDAVISRFNALVQTNVASVLHILHGKDGGLERHARDLVSLAPHAKHYILLALGEHWTIEDHTVSPPLRFAISHATDELWSDFFEGVCERFCISTIHVHHISACRDGLLLALNETQIPIIVTLHDFYYSCAAVHLLRGDDTYCGGETEVANCQRCLDEHPLVPKLDVAKWRAANLALLSRASQVIAPSSFTAHTTQRVFPTIPIRVIPHHSHVERSSLLGAPRAASTPVVDVPNGWVTFAVVGAIGPLKGARIVEAIAKQLAKRSAKARLVVIGYLDRQFSPGVFENGHFVVHGAYPLGAVAALLAAYKTDLVLFPAIGPETFGYALSEVWAAGYAPLVANVGTIAQRVHASGGGWVEKVPTAQLVDIDAWIDRALTLATPENRDEHHARARAGQALVQQENQDPTAYGYANRQIFEVSAHKQIASIRWLPPVETRLGGEPRATGILATVRALCSRVLAPLARSAVRFRHTHWGRTVERHLSPQTKRRLREWMTR